MFRKTLLTTTALVLGASVAFATHVKAPIHNVPYKPVNFGTAGHVVRGHAVNFSIGNTKHLPPVHNNVSHVTPGAIYGNFSKDKNAEFVSWYGFRVENSGFSSYFSSHDFFRDDFTASNAVPFSGGGTLKKMTFAGFSYEPSTAEYRGAILSRTASGLPGGTIATTASTTMSDSGLCCQSARKVAFPGTPTLPSGNYFAAVQCANSPCDGGWAMEDTDFSGATVDYYHYNETETYNFGTNTHTYHFSSPWHASTYYPTAGAVIVK
jgi:hypothetical protein